MSESPCNGWWWSAARRVAPVLGVTATVAAGAAALSGCGSGGSGGSVRAKPHADAACAATVASALGGVAYRVYHEGVVGPGSRPAVRAVAESSALHRAVTRGDGGAARSAIAALQATGHVGRVAVEHGGRVIADVGTRVALTPLPGTLAGAGGERDTFRVSVQDARGYASATRSMIGGGVVVRSGTRTLAGATLPRSLPDQGTVSDNGQTLQVVSFPAQGFSTGPLRIYVAQPRASLLALCRPTRDETVAATIGAVGARIYHQESTGHAAHVQLARAEHFAPLVSAVAGGDPAATRSAIVALLNQHIVRMRVVRGGRLLADVGGPYVLAPIPGTLRRQGRVIGRLQLSIQDDLGYLLLARRLAGAQAVLVQGARTVMTLLRPVPAGLPDRGAVTVSGRRYQVYSFSGVAFPSGPLGIRLLIPAGR